MTVEPDDLRVKVRAHRSPLSIAIVVDNSYSVHADRMAEKAKGLALAILEDAGTSGERVALVAFDAERPEATATLPLSRSRTLARRRLDEMPLARRTPLASAIRLGGRLLRQELLKRRESVALAVVITDGLPTVALTPGGDPLRDVLAEARTLRRRKIATVVIDGSDPGCSCRRMRARARGSSRRPLARVR